MEQNKEPRNESIPIWTFHIQQRTQKYKMGRREPFQEIILGKLYGFMQKNHTGLLPHTIYRNKLKMELRPKYDLKP